MALLSRIKYVAQYCGFCDGWPGVMRSMAMPSLSPQTESFERLNKALRLAKGPSLSERMASGKPSRREEFGLLAAWPAKHFWAFVVWNFETKQIEILEITQVTIQTALQSLIQNEDWGDPRQYSITVNRTGEKMETKYAVLPSPAKDVPAEILKAYEEKYINLDAFFTGGNPFDEADAGKLEVVKPAEEDLNEDVPF
jgi:hypothetical protein